MDVSPLRGYGLFHRDSTHSDIDQRDSPAVVLTAPKLTLEEGEDSLHQEVVEASACDAHHGLSSTGVTRDSFESGLTLIDQRTCQQRCRLLRVSRWRDARFNVAR